MYDNTISREADLPCKVWHPLLAEPAEQSGLSTEDYDNCSIESNYDSISLPCERKTPAKPLDPDTKAVTNISIFPKLRLLNLISTKEVCDPSPAPFNFTELETSVITKLKSLEQQFDEKRKVSLQKMEEQLLRIETKLDSLQNCRARMKRGTPSIVLKYVCVVKQHCRLLTADSKGRNEYMLTGKPLPFPLIFSLMCLWNKDFVIETLKQSIWLGLSDTKEEETWRWVDGSPLGELRSWRTGEPNNDGENGEDCAVLYKEGKWNDIRCDSRVKFVCEKEEVSVQ